MEKHSLKEPFPASLGQLKIPIKMAQYDQRMQVN